MSGRVNIMLREWVVLVDLNHDKESKRLPNHHSSIQHSHVIKSLYELILHVTSLKP